MHTQDTEQTYVRDSLAQDVSWETWVKRGSGKLGAEGTHPSQPASQQLCNLHRLLIPLRQKEERNMATRKWLNRVYIYMLPVRIKNLLLHGKVIKHRVSP